MLKKFTLDLVFASLKLQGMILKIKIKSLPLARTASEKIPQIRPTDPAHT
jgi:hypothetical protein